MIEIRHAYELGRPYILFVNGTPFKRAQIHITIDSERKKSDFSVWAYEEELVEKLGSLSFIDIAENIRLLRLKFKFDLPVQEDTVAIARSKDGSTFLMQFRFHMHAEWKEGFSFVEYAKEFTEILKQVKDSNVDWKKKRRYLRASFPIASQQSLILNEIKRYSDLLRDVHREVENNLSTRIYDNSIVLHFDFPQEVKIPCEQYLLYFVQFLRDLGIEATSELKDDAGKVLFAVTPNDSREALDKIRAALDIYLHLPLSPVSDTTNEAIAIQRMEATILRLRSDLKLAAAELQAKNATIEAQRLTIDIHKGLLSGEIVINSITDVTPKREDKEELLGGIVALATYKDKGVEINLAELYRKLKQLFKDKAEE